MSRESSCMEAGLQVVKVVGQNSMYWMMDSSARQGQGLIMDDSHGNYKEGAVFQYHGDIDSMMGANALCSPPVGTVNAMSLSACGDAIDREAVAHIKQPPLANPNMLPGPPAPAPPPASFHHHNIITTSSPPPPLPKVASPISANSYVDIIPGVMSSRSCTLPDANWAAPGHANRDGGCTEQKEILYRAAAMQPIDFTNTKSYNMDDAVGKPKPRRNERISKDPQSVAARLRRQRISNKMRVLQQLVPGGMKMDTASMLEEAAHYLKFLKAEVEKMETIEELINLAAGQVNHKFSRGGSPPSINDAFPNYNKLRGHAPPSVTVSSTDPLQTTFHCNPSSPFIHLNHHTRAPLSS